MRSPGDTLKIGDIFSESPRLLVTAVFSDGTAHVRAVVEPFEVDGIVYDPPPLVRTANEARRGGGGFFSIKNDTRLTYPGERMPYDRRPA